MESLKKYDLNLDAKPAKKAKKNQDDNVAGDDLIALDGDKDADGGYAPNNDDFLADHDNMANMINDGSNDSSFKDNKEGTEGMDEDDKVERKKSSRKSGKHKRDKGDRKERKKHKKGKKESRRLKKGRDTIGEPGVTETPAADGVATGVNEESKDGQDFGDVEVGQKRKRLLRKSSEAAQDNDVKGEDMEDEEEALNPSLSKRKRTVDDEEKDE